MTEVDGERSGTAPDLRSGTEPASLVGAVLDEEARRQADAAAADSDAAVDVATLPGVGGDAVGLRAALDRDQRRLLLTVGAMWGLGLAIFAMTAILASRITEDYRWSFRFLVQVAVLPGFTIVVVSQPLGNYVDRVTTNRPRVMRWMLALSVVALLLSGAAFYRWEFLGVLAFTGAGLLATVPVQASLLADAFPVRGRPDVFAGLRGDRRDRVRDRAAPRRVERRRLRRDERVADPVSRGCRARGRARVRRRPPP